MRAQIKMLFRAVRQGWLEGLHEGVLPDFQFDVRDEEVLIIASSRKFMAQLASIGEDLLDQTRDNWPESAAIPYHAALMTVGLLKGGDSFRNATPSGTIELKLRAGAFRELSAIYEMYPPYGYGNLRISKKPAPLDEQRYTQIAAEIARVAAPL